MDQETKRKLNEEIMFGQRRKLAGKRIVFLNGKEAKINGIRNSFATVAEINGPLAVEFSWLAVNRIVETDGHFKA